VTGNDTSSKERRAHPQAGAAPERRYRRDAVDGPLLVVGRARGAHEGEMRGGGRGVVAAKRREHVGGRERADVGARLERGARVPGDDSVALGDGDVLGELHDGKGEADGGRDREQREAEYDRGDPAEKAAVLLRANELADGVGDFVEVELRGGGAGRGGRR
jgi:hypothetical protein